MTEIEFGLIQFNKHVEKAIQEINFLLACCAGLCLKLAALLSSSIIVLNTLRSTYVFVDCCGHEWSAFNSLNHVREDLDDRDIALSQDIL